MTNICHTTIFNHHSKLTGLLFLLLTTSFFISPVQGQGQYGGGLGEKDNPYLIYTSAQMNEIGACHDDWAKHFKLMADIDLSAFTGTTFNIIGSTKTSKPFTGTFDGNNHKIINFTYHSVGKNEVGLFSYIDNNSDAEIRNLCLINPDVNAEGGTAVGVLVGFLGMGNITGCYVEDGNVSGENMVGGLVGWDMSGSISNCHATGEVSGDFYVGGLAGLVLSANIYDSYSRGGVSGTNAVGGLAGGANPVNCYSISDVSGVTRVGGLVGYGNAVGCYSAGSVSGSTIVGGLVGSEGAVNSYSLSSVSGDDRVGGLIGEKLTSITNCYSAGYVLGTTNVGGLVGYNNSGSSVNSSFWDTETSSQNNSDGGVGMATSQMRMKSTFSSVGWDFTTPLWAICEGTNYPRLAWEQKQAADFVCPDGVAMTDFAFLAAHWLRDNCEALNGYCEGCDLNRSGAVDFTDLRLFVDQWLTGIR